MSSLNSSVPTTNNIWLTGLLLPCYCASVIRVLSGMTDTNCPIWTVVGMLCQTSVGRHCAACKLFHSFDCLWLPDWHMVMSFAQHWFSPICISWSPAAVFVFIWCPVSTQYRVLHESDTFNITIYIIRFIISVIHFAHNVNECRLNTNLRWSHQPLYLIVILNRHRLSFLQIVILNQHMRCLGLM